MVTADWAAVGFLCTTDDNYRKNDLVMGSRPNRNQY